MLILSAVSNQMKTENRGGERVWGRLSDLLSKKVGGHRVQRIGAKLVIPLHCLHAHLHVDYYLTIVHGQHPLKKTKTLKMVQDADSKAHLKKIKLNTSFNGHFFTLSDAILPAQNEACRWNKQLHNTTWLFSIARFCLIN